MAHLGDGESRRVQGECELRRIHGSRTLIRGAGIPVPCATHIAQEDDAAMHRKQLCLRWTAGPGMVEGSFVCDQGDTRAKEFLLDVQGGDVANLGSDIRNPG